jgi:hypothetical protein
MDQSVMTFAGTAARGSAIGTATEGMLTYLNDSDSYQSWNGTAWVGVGGAATTNAVINGGFDIWQRGTSFTNPADNTYVSDRWGVRHNGTGVTRTITRETFTPGTAPVAGYEGAFFLRSAQTVAGTGQTFNNLFTRIEDVRSFANQAITVSFWARCSSGTINTSAGMEQYFGVGGSGSVFPFLGNLTLTTDWTRFTFTITVPSISGKTIGTNSFLQLAIGIPQNAISTIDFWGVQLEAGSTATPFKRNANSLQGELAACQRYYFRQSGTGNLLGDTGVAYSTTAAIVPCGLPVEMRVPPTSVEFSTIALNDGVTSRNMTNVALYAGSNQFTAGLNVFGGSGLTQFRPYFLMTQTGVFGFIAYSAEL